jgi:hypothetical protein
MIQNQMLIKKISIRLFIIVFCFLFFANLIFAQVGGRNSFEFLRIPSDARLAGVGGINVSLHQDDPNRWLSNPALLNDSLGHKAGFTYNPWQAGIAYFQLNYVHPFPKWGAVGMGLQVVNYGEMDLTTPSGATQGKFRASDFALNIAKSFRQDYFTYGATFKFVGSQIESYQALGFAVDIGGTFQHPKHDLTVGIVFKNLGFAFDNFTNQSVRLPFDIQLGASFKPQYMPFRASITLHHLYRFDIVYLDPTLSTRLDANGNPITEEKKFGDKLLRHFVLGGEMILSKGFQIQLGYNHLVNREFRLLDVSGLRGFSFGFRLRAKVWQFTYAYSSYFVGAGRSFLSLSGDLGKILKRKR